MSTLSVDICEYLREKGFDCVTLLRGGMTVLWIGQSATLMREPVGRKCIVPWHVTALSPEQAREQAKEVARLVHELVVDEGVVPIVMTEDRWRCQSEMMRSRLLAHLEDFIPLYARNCEVRKIDKETAATFLRENHSYGDAACRYRYGLYLKRYTGRWLEISRLASLARNDSVDSFARNDRVDSLARNDRVVEPGSLVAVATFSNARKWQKGETTIRSYEWTRYASLPGVRINGGMGKMLKAFVDDVHPDDVMSYADLEWSEGAVYEQLGFRLEGVKDPVLFSVDGQWRRSPVKPGMTGTVRPGMTGIVGQEMQDVPRYFQNLGSNKYRLKITEYE